MRSKQSGAAIVEFALVLPLLLTLTFITTEIGRALYQYNVLAKAVRDAARDLSAQRPWTVATAGSSDAVAAKTRARNLVVYGNPAGTGSPLAYGLTVSHVPMTEPMWVQRGASPVINTVTVTITGYTFTPLITGGFWGVNFGIINFAPIRATMRGAL